MTGCTGRLPHFRTCVVCNTKKPFTPEYFHNHLFLEKYKSYKSTNCRECHKIKMKKYNKVEYAKYREYYLVEEYKRIDDRAGLTTDLDEQWFKDNITSQPCFYCETTERPIGADRKDNAIGHTRENVIPCCKICNKVRNNVFSVEEMQELGNLIREIMSRRSVNV